MVKWRSHQGRWRLKEGYPGLMGRGSLRGPSDLACHCKTKVGNDAEQLDVYRGGLTPDT
jgi:hypothetical protein